MAFPKGQGTVILKKLGAATWDVNNQVSEILVRILTIKRNCAKVWKT